MSGLGDGVREIDHLEVCYYSKPSTAYLAFDASRAVTPCKDVDRSTTGPRDKCDLMSGCGDLVVLGQITDNPIQARAKHDWRLCNDVQGCFLTMSEGPFRGCRSSLECVRERVSDCSVIKLTNYLRYCLISPCEFAITGPVAHSSDRSASLYGCRAG